MFVGVAGFAEDDADVAATLRLAAERTFATAGYYAHVRRYLPASAVARQPARTTAATANDRKEKEARGGGGAASGVRGRVAACVGAPAAAGRRTQFRSRE